MLTADRDALFARAAALCVALNAGGGPTHFRPVRTAATTGGGTMPSAEIPSAGIAAAPRETPPTEFAARLCAHRPPVVGRVQDAEFIVDLRTVREDEDAALCAALLACT
jgi:L-seryl-tRNA(Ser) seleniumtransferase